MRSRDAWGALGAMTALGLIVLLGGFGSGDSGFGASGAGMSGTAGIGLESAHGTSTLVSSVRGLESGPGQAPVQQADFHHVHLNVTDPDSTRAYYETFFGALPIEYRDRSEGLFTERSFLLLDQVEQAPDDNIDTAIAHIGWAGVHGPTEFDWRLREGIEYQTPITPLGSNYYMYFYGPDRELVEIYTGSRNHRFEHVHLNATDIDETMDWLEQHLGLESGPARTWTGGGMRTNSTRVDNVNLVVFEVPGSEENWPDVFPRNVRGPFAPTEGRVVDHIAFSYRDIEPVERRMREAGVTIVSPTRERPEHGIRSFFVRAPDNLLVEIVEAKPIPEGLWEE